MERTRTEFSKSLQDRDRTIAAIAELEQALAKAVSRERWIDDVSAAVTQLESALVGEAAVWSRPESLLRLIEEQNPRRFGPRIRHIKAQLADLTRQVTSLGEQTSTETYSLEDSGDLRHRVSWLLRALRHYHAGITDLVYEAIGLNLADG